uniref:Uncharacterized protein n=1 Tax=Parascaris equorum TaxID=6256 RepID=A0A914R8F7_PAREQ
LQPNAGYCACPPQAVYRSCNSVSDSILKEYLDAHTIHIVMSRSPQAFIYIFEFSTVSTSPDDWMFAGTSVTPEITFTTRDPCRDYQFRVLVVLRSTNPREIHFNSRFQFCIASVHCEPLKCNTPVWTHLYIHVASPSRSFFNRTHLDIDNQVFYTLYRRG